MTEKHPAHTDALDIVRTASVVALALLMWLYLLDSIDAMPFGLTAAWLLGLTVASFLRPKEKS